MKLSEGSTGTLSIIHSNCIQKNLPFFSYRMPYSTEIVSGVQMTEQLMTFSGFENLPTGFLVAPFDLKSAVKPLFIQSDITFRNDKILQNELELILNSTVLSQRQEVTPNEVSKESYLLQAEELIATLKADSLQKVVLSRALNSDLSNKNQAPFLFEKLTQLYPHAFVSIFSIPGNGVWIGATPETLLLTNPNGIETMSLAATKPISSIKDWTPKERQEQQMVSDFVENVLKDFSFEEIRIDGPMDQQAGNVIHLMTKYNCRGKLNEKSQKELIDKLHPTPAVCGIPIENAMQLIRETELHDREYYAGYIGPVDAQKTQLFVNLRCMKMTSKGVTFFVGGGLTAQSIAEEEWQETCLKLETLKRIL